MSNQGPNDGDAPKEHHKPFAHATQTVKPEASEQGVKEEPEVQAGPRTAAAETRRTIIIPGPPLSWPTLPTLRPSMEPQICLTPPAAMLEQE